jgi:hypothetical protein
MYLSIYAAISNGKQKPKQFSLIRLPFAHQVVCPYVDEETDGSYPFANRLNGLVRLWK